MVRTSLLLAGLSVALSAPLAAADPLPHWRDGLVTPNGDAGMLYMGDKGGFARSFGLDSETVALRGDPLVLKALVAGQVDSFIGGPASSMVAASKGADLKMVGCNWNKQSYVLWGGKDVKTLADLRGKSIGISSPGSAPSIFIRAALQKAGVASDQVTFVAAGMPSDWLKSMAAGVISGAATPDEYQIRGEQMGLKVLTTSDEATPLSMQRCYMVSGATLRDKRDLVVRFLASEMAAYRYSLAHRDATNALTRTLLSIGPDAPEPTANYDSVVRRGVIDMSFEPPIEKLRWLRDLLSEEKLVAASWDPQAMIDLGPLADARKMLAEKGTRPDAEVESSLAAAGVASVH